MAVCSGPLRVLPGDFRLYPRVCRTLGRVTFTGFLLLRKRGKPRVSGIRHALLLQPAFAVGEILVAGVLLKFRFKG